jgi:3-deoxy-7-phosphoheptulonate synthase
MIIVMKMGAGREEIKAVEGRLVEMGYQTHPIYGQERTVIGAVGDSSVVGRESILNLPGVERIVPILKPYKLVSRELYREDSKIRVGQSEVGGPGVVVIAGPCVVEDEEQVTATARAARAAGCDALRGGAFKPRTSPYAYQGLGEEGLRLLSEAGNSVGLPVVSEVMDTRDVEMVHRYVDVLQVGARNMQNFALLREVGIQDKPVILKRGLSATVEEWLMAAEYIMSAGNPGVILCERGIRTYENGTRNTLDLSAVLQVKANSHLPVIVDPSHGTGVASMVGPMSRAAIAAGADGVMVEIHPDPSRAKCDGPQSLDFPALEVLMEEIRALAPIVGREVRPVVTQHVATDA